MAEPLGDFLHRDALVPKQGRAAVAEVVEADLPEVIVLKELWKVRGNPAGTDDVSVLEAADVLIEIVVVAVAEDLLHLFSSCFHVQQDLHRPVGHRKRAEGRGVLRGIP